MRKPTKIFSHHLVTLVGYTITLHITQMKIHLQREKLRSFPHPNFQAKASLLHNLPFQSLRRGDANAALQPEQVHLIALEHTPRAHGLDGVLDLAAIQLPQGKLQHVGLGEVIERVLEDVGGDGVFAVRRRRPRREARQELPPQDEPAGGRQRREEQVDVDARAERDVDGRVQVRGEEDDALEVFELAEEDGHELVAHDVGRGPLRHEDVGFVEEDHRVPFRSHLEDLFDLGAQEGGVGAEFFGLEVVERTACLVRYGFCCQSLASPGRAGEEED